MVPQQKTKQNTKHEAALLFFKLNRLHTVEVPDRWISVLKKWMDKILFFFSSVCYKLSNNWKKTIEVRFTVVVFKQILLFFFPRKYMKMNDDLKKKFH